MQIAHFSIHAYGSWLPDHLQGYVSRLRGWQPQDVVRGWMYRDKMRGKPVSFDEAQQRCLIDEVLVAGEYQDFEPRAMATEWSHLHVVLAWADSVKLSHRRDRLKSSLSRRLNREFERQRWLARGGGVTAINKPEHYDYLLNEYLPAHSGWKWQHRKGWYR
jgi:hypothetical protein